MAEAAVLPLALPVPLPPPLIVQAALLANSNVQRRGLCQDPSGYWSSAALCQNGLLMHRGLQLMRLPSLYMYLIDLSPKLSYHACDIIGIEVKGSQIWEGLGCGC